MSLEHTADWHRVADVFGKVNRKFMSDLYAKHKIFRAIG